MFYWAGDHFVIYIHAKWPASWRKALLRHPSQKLQHCRMKLLRHLNMRHMPHTLQLYQLGTRYQLLRSFTQLHKVAQRLDHLGRRKATAKDGAV
jgi:hypothetical protein